MNCWKCAKSIGETPVKISFRATCPHCGIDLHTCTNCKYYLPGKPNDCIVPGTEYVRDREVSNLCEDFRIKTESTPIKREEEKKKFNSLFKEE